MTTTPKDDRVATVVARVAVNTSPYDSPMKIARRTVEELDAAGLLLRDELRDRLVALLGDAGTSSIRLEYPGTWHERRRGLLDELTRAPTPPEPAPVKRRMRDGDGTEHDESPDCRGLCSPVVEPARPRRMAGQPNDSSIGKVHREEHDENVNCAQDPPCQPVAASAHDPRDFDPGAGAPMGVFPTDAAPTHEHRWAAVAWVHELFYRNDALGTREWRACGRAGAERMRVTREHCVVGDCTATREVTP